MDHARVHYYLTTAPNPKLYSIGQNLKDLRESRNQADYDMAVVVDQKHSRSALAWADSAIMKSITVDDGTLKAAMNAIGKYPGDRTP